MKTLNRLAKGDKVAHPKRPEWGHGTVREARALMHEGVRAQRVTVDFPNKGRVVLNTAIAPLETKSTGRSKDQDDQPKLSPRNTPTALAVASAKPLATSAPLNKNANGDPSASNAGWLDALDPSSAKANELWELPDDLTNPFASLGERLAATLQTYKFNTQPRPLMDWAHQQTGLADPLSKYTRHELEQAFPRYARDRDAHLKDLVKQLKRNNDFATLKDCGRGLFSAAQSALDKAIRH